MNNPIIKAIVIIFIIVSVMSFWYVKYVSGKALVAAHIDGYYRVEVDEESSTLNLFTNYSNVFINGSEK